MKKRKGSILMPILIIILMLCAVMYNAYESNPLQMLSFIEYQNEKRNLVTMDKLIFQWYGSHANEFPTSLESVKFIGCALDISKYEYTTYSDKTKYKLTTNVDDEILVSPGSNYDD